MKRCGIGIVVISIISVINYDDLEDVISETLIAISIVYCQLCERFVITICFVIEVDRSICLQS